MTQAQAERITAYFSVFMVIVFAFINGIIDILGALP